MEIKFSPTAMKDFVLIKKSHTKSTNNRLKRILESMLETPYEGFGSPEALKHELTGKYSRELSKKDRVVYSVHNEIIEVDSLLGHYSK